MFRIIAGLGLFLVIGGIAYHYRLLQASTGENDSLRGALRNALTELTDFRKTEYFSNPMLMGILKGLYVVLLFSTALLFLTGFTQVLLLGQHISGFFLILHSVAAPFFALSLAGISLLWAWGSRFTGRDWEALRNETSDGGAIPFTSPALVATVRKICFWGILCFAVPAIFSIILSMYPVLGTPGQDAMINLHRYSTLAITLFALIHTYLTLIRSRLERPVEQTA